MFGFSDNDVQTGGDVADPAVAPVGGGSLDHNQMIVPPTSAPALDEVSAPNSSYIMTDVAQPSGSDIPVQHPDPASVPAGHSNDLLALKQSALQELSPLVSHLEQTPEEKFRTTMMLIQASDNQDLLRDAFQAAKGITDEKARAQALLDVVNEINYFTQQSENE